MNGGEGAGPLTGRAHRLLLGLPLLGVALGSRSFGAPVLPADLALVAFVGLAGLIWLRKTSPGSWERAPFSSGLALFGVAALASGLVPWLLGSELFEPLEFVKSAAKLLLYTLAAVAFWSLAQALPRPDVGRVVGNVFGLAALVAMGLYLAPWLGFDLPRELLCGEPGPTCSAIYYERRWFGDASALGLARDAFLRAQGLASEPNRFGYLQAMALGFVLLAPGGRREPLRAMLIAISVLLSFALAPYAVGAAIAALGLFQLRSRRLALQTVLAGLVALGLTLSFPGARPALEHAIFARVARIATGGEDSSARLRVVGSWRLAAHLAARRPLTGVGLGNYDVAVARLREEFPERRFLTGSIQGWNALAYVFGTTGGFGLLAFLLLGAQGLRRQATLALVFVVGCFADGTVLSAAFWIFFALYALPPPPDTEARSQAT